MGNWYGRRQAEVSRAEIAAQTEAKLATSLMNHGWRPALIELNHIPFYFSYFKPALLGSIAFPIVKDEVDDKTYFLLNIQTRRLRNGQIKDVVDFPCGFYQSNQSDLAYKKELLRRVFEMKQTLGRAISSEELQHIVQLFNEELSTDKLILEQLPWDKNVIETGIREFNEETGQVGLTLMSAKHFKTRIVQGGAYVYNMVELRYRKSGDTSFSSEYSEGVQSSHLIALRQENFRFAQDDLGLVQGEVLIPNKGWVQIKPYDDAAAMMAYYLQIHHRMDFSLPGQAIAIDDELKDPHYEHKNIDP
ncbi:hypothetical protein [Legionella impletisoli]|uniref:hypothetical protein n=1 Tax=Legionella impletisoli TaxID=343510 RepID=UPI0010414A79|nr:hypothetical protein [Legionella impletisoli]